MAAAVRGVDGVTNQLEPHENSEGVPSLQGEGRLAGPSMNPRAWAPGTKALVGASVLAAGALMALQASRANGQTEEWYGAM
jgi:hypothetical protein